MDNFWSFLQDKQMNFVKLLGSFQILQLKLL